jgi:hypothetical protein
VIDIHHKSWLLHCDPEATWAAYGRIENGAPERCSCDHCLNFIAQRDQILPARSAGSARVLGHRSSPRGRGLSPGATAGRLAPVWRMVPFHRDIRGSGSLEADASGGRRLRMVPVDGRFSLTFRRDAARSRAAEGPAPRSTGVRRPSALDPRSPGARLSPVRTSACTPGRLGLAPVPDRFRFRGPSAAALASLRPRSPWR